MGFLLYDALPTEGDEIDVIRHCRDVGISVLRASYLLPVRGRRRQNLFTGPRAVASDDVNGTRCEHVTGMYDRIAVVHRGFRTDTICAHVTCVK